MAPKFEVLLMCRTQELMYVWWDILTLETELNLLRENSAIIVRNRNTTPRHWVSFVDLSGSGCGPSFGHSNWSNQSHSHLHFQWQVFEETWWPHIAFQLITRIPIVYFGWGKKWTQIPSCRLEKASGKRRESTANTKAWVLEWTSGSALG